MLTVLAALTQSKRKGGHSVSIIIHEYLDSNGGIGHNFTERLLGDSVDISEANTPEQAIDPTSLMVDIEAIHAMPHATRNYTRYTDKCLKNSIQQWTKPYSRPLIKHHNEKNGDIIGRVIGASYKTRDTFSNTPALVLTVNVPQEQAKIDIKNGINQTVSIGVIAHDVRCSICGKQIELDDDGNVISCEHKKGRVYNKETAYWDIYSMEPKEVSYVIVPSDMFARNIRSYPATKSSPSKVSEASVTESLDETIKGEIENMDVKEMETKLQAAEEKISSLTAGLKVITESKDSLDSQVKSLNTSLEEANKKVSVAEAEVLTLKNKLEILTAEKTALETKVSDLQEAAKEQESKASDETKMREGLEAELTATKAVLKESLINNLQALRKIAGKKELEESVLQNREEASIRDSIEDLKLEISEKTAESKQNTLPSQVTSPALAEEAAEDNKDIKESASVNLKAGLENIFMAVAGAHR